MVYLFEAADTGWTRQSKISPDQVSPQASFGRTLTVAADARTASVGARNDDTDAGTQSGAVYALTI